MLRITPRCVTRLNFNKTFASQSSISGFKTINQGSKYSQNFKQYLCMPNGDAGSFFHDVPLGLTPEDATVNMVVEIPRWSNAKFEISKELKLNPITQDTKKGKLRFVNNIFPFKGYMHNYGAIPQTWEDPTTEEFQGTGLKGDNDPLDCCEIGSAVLNIGEIKRVKILGSLGLIDDGELDWKVIAIDINDPLAGELQNLTDVEKHMPTLLHHTREWFRNYKVPQGKPRNEFAFNEEYLDVAKTLSVIQKCNKSWEKLLSGKDLKTFDSLPTTQRSSKNIRISTTSEIDSPLPSETKIWHYV
ncbi:similar to Saccharomyces cerevisiae YMR267W PPA2 Mitochondrial inorganic pyrophosphatase [Maudiozyma saulgeensis]|uniref:inorganic diphosphatase n=1 Tax=Maudiozyma saulgeensis TaxID=1789683 RepID=A0A1X7R8V9_9SACH|nr:similar to Saccharomyces cerevisiae YMR267W PPA2 Mitochondrial inorganic pyrophosphatase [Kazachstania saulgeensis]